MSLNLRRPLCFIDLETTGTNIISDRIIEIAILRVNPDGSKETKEWMVNPCMDIPKESSAIHGITYEDVKDCPPFKRVAREIYNFLSNADLAGYNSNRFDIPMLVEEFNRAELVFDFSSRK